MLGWRDHPYAIIACDGPSPGISIVSAIVIAPPTSATRLRMPIAIASFLSIPIASTSSCLCALVVILSLRRCYRARATHPRRPRSIKRSALVALVHRMLSGSAPPPRINTRRDSLRFPRWKKFSEASSDAPPARRCGERIITEAQRHERRRNLGPFLVEAVREPLLPAAEPSLRVDPSLRSG